MKEASVEVAAVEVGAGNSAARKPRGLNCQRSSLGDGTGQAYAAEAYEQQCMHVDGKQAPVECDTRFAQRNLWD